MGARSQRQGEVAVGVKVDKSWAYQQAAGGDHLAGGAESLTNARDPVAVRTTLQGYQRVDADPKTPGQDAWSGPRGGQVDARTVTNSNRVYR